MFSLMDEIPYKVIYEGYDAFKKRYVVPYDGYAVDDNFLFSNYLMSQAKRYDISISEVLVGRKRSSKSTEGLWEVYDIYQGRNDKFNYKEYVDKYVIYDYSQMANDEEGSVRLNDEKHLTGDRRRFMSRANVETSVDINFYADNLNIDINLIQNYSDLDPRVIDTATILKFVLKRGHGMLFMSRDSIPIIKQDFGMWIFQQNPDMVKNSSVTQSMMRSKPEYVCDYFWNTMEKRDDMGTITWQYPLFSYYKQNKKMWQNRRKEMMANILSKKNPYSKPVNKDSQLTEKQILSKQIRDKIKMMYVQGDTSTMEKDLALRHEIADKLKVSMSYVITAIKGRYDEPKSMEIVMKERRKALEDLEASEPS